jgi:hypothetical protein
VAVPLLLSLSSRPAIAQVTPTPQNPPPDDTPSVRVGGTLFLDYTYTLDPQITDADGNRVDPNAFNVTRGYINVTGQLNHVFAFRVTPDISRETGTGSSLAGSMTFRLKYGYVQVNLDDWMWRGSYVRGGMIQTPYVEFEESIYRYRFQGPIFADREDFLTSADFGVSFRTQFPRNYGEVVGGVYNGDGYDRADPNDQKALQVRGTLRPFPEANLARGFRVTLFYDDDHYVKDADRQRFVSLLSFEHRFLHAGFVFLDAADQVTVGDPRVDASGQSFWIVPRLPLAVPPKPPAGFVRASLEGLFRYDRLEPNQSNPGTKERWIAGVAYWPSMRVASVSAAFLLNYEQVRYRDFTPARPTEKRIALHTLVTF